MEQIQKDACAGSSVPGILLTGQSGSGKSTALGELLASVPAHVEVAVCVHRHAKGFGLETTRLRLPPSASYHEVYDFGSGCLCCSPKGELVRVLAELTGRPLGALVIETTGVADPTPFLKLLLEEEVARDF